MRILKQCLEKFKRNPTEFKRRFIGVEETGIHHYNPAGKLQSKQWVAAGRTAPKRLKTPQSPRKVLATDFSV